MFNFIRRAILIKPPSPSLPQGFSVNPLQFSFRYRSTSSPKEHSFAISYLVNTLGFSPESALLATRYVNFETQKKPDSVIELLKNHGFSKSQISELVKKLPQVISADPEKTLLPQLLFFQSKGLSSPEIVKLLIKFPTVLKTSLNKRIIPSFNYVQDFLQSEVKTIATIKRYTGILTWDIQVYAHPNIEFLKEIGVPESNIRTMLQCQPQLFLAKPCRFKEIVEEVKDMGFNPLRLTFLIAVFGLRSMSKSTWKQKVEVYKKWGWSEEEIMLAFRRHPWCMMASESKINAVMDFYINKLGIKSVYLVKRPALITMSLKNRIVPRGSVYQALVSKGFIKEGVFLPRLFDFPENLFLDKFIKPYESHVPSLLNLYKKKLDVSEG